MAWTHPVEGTPKDSRPRAGELAVTGGPQSVVVPFQKRKSFANFVFGFPADRQVGVACLTRTLRRRISSSEAAECGGHGFCSPQRRGLISLRDRRLGALRAGASDRLCWRWTGTWGGHIPKYVSKRATIGAYFVVAVWVSVPDWGNLFQQCLDPPCRHLPLGSRRSLGVTISPCGASPAHRVSASPTGRDHFGS